MAEPFADDTMDWTPEGSNLTLSDRIWRNRQALEAKLDTIIQDGIREGKTVEAVGDELIRYVKPSYRRYGDGTARYAAVRLAQHETRRARSIGTQQTAMADPAGGYLRYRTSAGHILPDECTGHANRVTRYGRGVYPAKDAPLPPRHIGCRCRVERLSIDGQEPINDVVDRLRVEYGLDEVPPELSPSQLVTWRRETQQVKDGVVIMFRAWLQQTGLVTREQLVETSTTVAGWVAKVKALKRRIVG